MEGKEKQKREEDAEEKERWKRQGKRGCGEMKENEK